MADFVLRGIEPEMAERIKALARERSWAINDVILHLIKQSLGMNPVVDESKAMSFAAAPVREVVGRGGYHLFGQDEDHAMRAAIEAFERLPVQAAPLS